MSKTEAFKVACDYALLEMIENLSRGASVHESWDNHSKIVGAKELLDVLKILHQPQPERKPSRGEELGYDNIPDFSGGPKL